MTATCFVNRGYESHVTLKRIADALEKIERHLAKNCETPKATPASRIDYTYDARNANHPFKATPTRDVDDEEPIHDTVYVHDTIYVDKSYDACVKSCTENNKSQSVIDFCIKEECK